MFMIFSVQSIIANHFKVLFRNVNNKPFNKVKGRNMRNSHISDECVDEWIAEAELNDVVTTVTSQQKWTQKSFKKRNESQYFVNLLKPTAFIPRFA